ncbi:MAG TPA: hypothetical protein PKK06_05600 [Phycisphaerae bacterium]|nr:hypothetical protein [Phycisphaerae bacterium]HNU44767.1 hypothetical protein [Phycisphaerae bacterium]
MAQAKPVQKFRAGAISCALWDNDIRVGNLTKPVLRCTVERRYKDSDGTWKSTGSYGRNEIPLVLHCLQQAFAYMIDDSNHRSEEGSAEEETVL